MPQPETSIGGSREAFPETVWSSITRGRGPLSAEQRHRLGELLKSYWRPVYKYVRTAGGRTIEDAKDITQDFMLRLLRSDLLDRYRPSLGRFRAFLKGAIDNHLSQLARDSSRHKRGGGRSALPLDAVEEAAREFDAEWADEVMSRGIADLRKELRVEGRTAVFQLFEAYELCPDDSPPTYKSLAQRFQLTEAQVSHGLQYARTRLRDALARIVSEYARSSSELHEELRELYPE